MSSLTEHRSDPGEHGSAPTRPGTAAGPPEATATRLEQGLARELRASALLLGLSFGLTAVVVVSAQAAAALLGA